jgi:nucleoid DNA-binding protein
MASGPRKAFKGHDPYNPKDYPPVLAPAKAGWPAQVGHKHLRVVVQQWFLEHGNYELPADIVDKAIRYTFAAVRYFVDREHTVVLKGMGKLHYKLIEGRKGRNRFTGEIFPVQPHVEVGWRPSKDWVDDLTFARFQRPRKRTGLHRARQRYYVRRLAELGLLTPDLSDTALERIGMTRNTLLKAIAERENQG